MLRRFCPRISLQALGGRALQRPSWGRTFQRFGVTIDTHTADGVKVAREHLQAGQPMLVLETALPIKFAETIVEALGHAPDRPAQFDGIEDLPKRVQVMACDVQLVKDYITRHCDV